jgi:hypothetical protein
LFQISVQRDAFYVFHHQKHLLWIVKCFEQLDDVFVVHFRQDFYFSDNALSSLRVEQFVLVVDFDCDSSSLVFVEATADYSVGTLTNLLAHLVVVDVARLTGAELTCSWTKGIVVFESCSS